MAYSFKVIECEEKMKNFFRGATGRLIKDTIIITIKNNGSKPWAKWKGYFRCLPEKSNIYFDTFQITEDVYPNGVFECVLNYPRIKKNFNSGKMISTIQLVYKDEVYNDDTIQFTKSFDITGYTVIRIRKEKEAAKIKKEEEAKKKLKADDEMIPVEGGDEKMINMVKKFRNVFNMQKEDFTDDYIKKLLIDCNYDFQEAFEYHITLSENEKKKNEDLVKDENKLKELVIKFRDSYQLAKEDYPDDVIKDALVEGKGDFYAAFSELMSFIE